MSRPPSWPIGVIPIEVEDLDRLGRNAANELFWDGRRIEVRQSLVLTRLQKTAAIFVTLFAVLGGLDGFVSGVNNASVFLCARNVLWLRCPLLPASGPAPPPPPPARR